MIITSIEIQKKNKNRYSLFIDDEFYCGVHEDVIVNLALHKNMSVDQSFLNQVFQEEMLAKGKYEALHYISYRMRSKKEVIDKLKNLDYDEETIDQIMPFLYEHRFIDDLAFAKAFISDKCRLSKHSLKKIRYSLQEKGIDETLFTKASEEYLDYDLINLEKLLPSKYNKLLEKHKNEPFVLDQKIKSFFYQKGFHIEDIKQVLNQLKKDQNSI